MERNAKPEELVTLWDKMKKVGSIWELFSFHLGKYFS
jgi:hypothetical protein